MRWQWSTDAAVALTSVLAALALAALLQALSLSAAASVPASTPRPSLTHIHAPATIPVPHATRSNPS